MTIEPVRRALAGISGVHITPYDKDGAVEPRLLARICRFIAEAGVQNIVSAGNTGEFYALDGDEVRLVHDTAIAAVDAKALVTAAVGRSLKEAIALGRRAASAGADAVMAHQPLDPFAAPAAQAGYFCAIADAIEVPLVAYVRSDAFSIADLLMIAHHPNIVAVKFATTSLMLLADCVRRSEPGSALWVCGLAESWAPAFYAVGARGFTSGLVNVAPQRSLAILAAIDAGDFQLGRRLVAEIAAFEQMRGKFNNGANVTVIKEACMLQGLDVGPVRLPGHPRLGDADRRALADILRGWDATSVVGPALTGDAVE